jgi:galactokinase/mevalonate kinase-like predicted kinase
VPVPIRAKAPLRLSFAGGGTDITPFMEREGGGYLLLYCEYEKKHKVAEAVRKLGGVPTEFSFEFHGLQTWRRNGHGNNGNR